MAHNGGMRVLVVDDDEAVRRSLVYALCVHISYPRAKLEAGGAARLIQTVRGIGYVLREEP